MGVEAYMVTLLGLRWSNNGEWAIVINHNHQFYCCVCRLFFHCGSKKEGASMGSHWPSNIAA